MSDPRPANGTVLAFDYGRRRIGVGVGECSPPTASALTTIAAKQGDADWVAMDQLIAEWRPVILLVGLPLQADGSDGTMTGAAREFAEQLSQRYELPVTLVDESLSSHAAYDELRHQRKKGMLRRRVKRGDTDKVAARIILERWLSTAPET